LQLSALLFMNTRLSWLLNAVADKQAGAAC
jgi:hypothetical protein